jgi:hypothetical protein
MNETLFTIIKYAVSILVLVVFRYLIPFVSNKLKDQKYVGLIAFIEKAVNAAESIYKLISKSGEQKKAYVVEKIKEYIKKNHINITDGQIDLLIQAVFTELDKYTINTNK